MTNNTLTARPRRPPTPRPWPPSTTRVWRIVSPPSRDDPRKAQDLAGWFDGRHPVIAVVDQNNQVVGYAATFSYADRCCYAGIAEFSVYVRRSHRGKGVGVAAMTALIDAAAEVGFWKLLSRVFVENKASLSLLRSVGFREVGVHEKHGKLDGVWRDVVAVEKVLEGQPALSYQWARQDRSPPRPYLSSLGDRRPLRRRRRGALGRRRPCRRRRSRPARPARS
ncbi:arsinothricin resistance N-acetyltransferase ArsN1 family A [Caulobacter segnis]